MLFGADFVLAPRPRLFILTIVVYSGLDSGVSTVYANIFANKNCREIHELGIVTAY
jgi:hypothetical protein